MIFKLMMNFKPGDTWETIFLISNTGSSEEKIWVKPVTSPTVSGLVIGETPVVRTRVSYSKPPVSLLKTAFLKIIYSSEPPQKRKCKSHPLQSDTESDPIQAIRSWFCWQPLKIKIIHRHVVGGEKKSSANWKSPSLHNWPDSFCAWEFWQQSHKKWASPPSPGILHKALQLLYQTLCTLSIPTATQAKNIPPPPLHRLKFQCSIPNKV